MNDPAGESPPDVTDAARRAAERLGEAVESVGEAVDRAVDAIAGVALEPGRVESFTDDGVTLVAETHEGTTPVFVLVHGMGMGRSVFADLAQRLISTGTVIAIDQPGYGEAPEPDRTPTIERTADLVAAFLRQRGGPPAVLVGHSMGTQVCTEVAARHPSLVDRLVLVGPSVNKDERHGLRQLLRLAQDLLLESPKVLLLGSREYLRARPHVVRKMRMMLRHRPEDAYPRIAAPTLVLRGETDVVCPREWCRFVADAIPDARLAEIPVHGHETMIKDAAPAARLIVDFSRSG